ncbi:MAG TPA: cell wall-binding repeat-containing protein [Micromonosporaceae bacterium]|nr:cell wall-binding repeat-containing protein [Micromonosporaceae bacterium]
MSLKRKPATIVIAAVAALGAGITLTVLNGAYASHPGQLAGLTTVSGHTVTIVKPPPANPATLTITPDAADGGAWSADGSQLAFVTTDGDVETVRFNDGTATTPLTAGDDSPKSHPTWTSDGNFVVWAGQEPTDADSSLYVGGLGGLLPPTRVDLPTGLAYGNPDGGPGGVIVFDATSAGNTDVESINETDLFSTSTLTPATLVTNALQPSISPDGTHVAFVRADDDGHLQILTIDLSTRVLVTLTTDAKDHLDPTWSPDGTTIAFDDGVGVFTVPADGSQAPSPFGGLSGRPAYEPANADSVFRIEGANRFGTAVATSQFQWGTAGDPTSGGTPADAVVLTRSDTFADALGGSALAAAKNGPLLMTSPNVLNAQTAAEISRVLGPTSTDPIYILGGTSAISAAIETQLKHNYPNTTRLSGANRYATAVEVANAINPHPAHVFATTGLNFPDALAAGAAAGGFDEPGLPTNDAAVVVLTADGNLPADTKTYLQQNAGTDLWAIGGPAAAALQAGHFSGNAIVGGNRYETALDVWFTFSVGSSVVGISTGTNWPDSLAGGALMGTVFGPMLLVPPTIVQPSEITVNLEGSSAEFGAAFVFGGASAVSDTIKTQIGTWISGPGGFDLFDITPGAGHPLPQAVRTARAAHVPTGGSRHVHAPINLSAPGIVHLSGH